MTRWKTQDVDKLKRLFNEGKTYLKMSLAFDRTTKAIKIKGFKLGLKYQPLTEEYWEELECEKCSKITKVRKKEKRRFCSKSCAAAVNNKLRKQKLICILCNNVFWLGYKSSRTECFTCKPHYQKISRPEQCKSSNSLRKYLLRTRIHLCTSCGNTEWLGRPIPLEVDHIDGNSGNNKESNLRLICPNCHAQTPTYKGKNTGNGRHWRRQRYKEGKSY